MTLFQKAGVDVGIMGQEESCCGARAYGMGYREEFNTAAGKLVDKWNTASVKTILTPCADCYYGFKHLYPKVGAEFKVYHTVEYLDLLIKEGRITFTQPIPMTVTYHDPCHLGRMGEPFIPWNGVEKKIRKQVVVYEPKKPRRNGALGVYDSPRDILRSIPGLNLVEMERIREYAWCCGAGGGVREAFPEFSEWTASERIEEANSVGAEAIVSACPWCKINFTNAATTLGEKIKVFDLVDLVSQSI
jgi:Fe-S oxidoreductase